MHDAEGHEQRISDELMHAAGAPHDNNWKALCDTELESMGNKCLSYGNNRRLPM